MAYARFGPCPHCQTPLAYLEGVSGSTANPQCPRCHQVVKVPHATFLMPDNSWSGRKIAKGPLVPR
jgi:hypothetical protein